MFNKMNEKQTQTFNTGLTTIRSNETDTWKLINVLAHLAIAHVYDGGNVKVLEQLINATQSRRRRDLFKFLSAMVPYDTDRKAMKFLKKTKSTGRLAAVESRYTDFRIGKQKIQTWIGALDATKEPKVLTKEQKSTKLNKLLTSALNDDGFTFDEVVAFLTAILATQELKAA